MTGSDGQSSGRVALSFSDGAVRLSFDGKFDFSVLRDFKDAMATIRSSPAPTGITVDLSKVSYMDSSALGMLLTLRDLAISNGIPTPEISGVAGHVSDVLAIANFNRIFRYS